jgi:beta-galactosidase
MRKVLSLFILVFCFTNVGARIKQNFDSNWSFVLGDSIQMSLPKYDDSKWRKLNLPHDWSIEGDFNASNPSGAGGGALPGGVGWYRKHFEINKKDKDSRFYVHFDGVYMNSTVYINGHKLGNRPYGFISFEYDMTPFIKTSEENVIAVRVDNSQQPNCRWYSGSGIYRHVYLLKTSNLRIANWGTFVKTVSITNKEAILNVDIRLNNSVNKSVCVKVTNSVLDTNGKTLAKNSETVTVPGSSDRGLSQQTIKLQNPKLWSIDNPYTYRVKTDVTYGSKRIDSYITTIGLRSFKFDANTGFSLNGESIKIKGVCNHHDLGCLGAAINEDALHRQLVMLKNMGCNSIRCSHNPPAPELLNMCDTMGFIVMDEAFDMWHKKKTQYDYSQYFDKWFERDLTDMVVRDRNHPSVFIWSIGNEVLEQWSDASSDTLSIEQANTILNFGHSSSMLSNDKKMSINSMLTKRLADIVKSLDDSRPVTAACNEPSPNNNLFKSGSLDLIGYNYHNANAKNAPLNFPGKPFIFTESVSAFATRGYYQMPSDSIIKAPKQWWIPYTDPSFMCSSYDNCRASWGNLHEETWDLIKHSPFISGEYIWTGYDYIGEPTPYGFPARSSYFGIIDLAGFPKDIYYMYQSEWTDKPVLHLFPHWNWIPEQKIDMWCYYNKADEVELYINGISQGIRRKESDHQYHVVWPVIFQPGKVTVVARKSGKEISRQTINTAGTPDHIRLVSDRNALRADGKSLAFITVEVVDKDGNVCPNADNQVFFTVQGSAKIAGVDNGNQTSMERFKANNRKAFFGKCLVVLQSTSTSGTIQLTAKSVDLKDGMITLTNK